VCSGVDAASRIDVENARRWRVPAASLTASSKENGRSRESASCSTSTRCGSASDLRSSFGSPSRVVGPPSQPSAYERSDGSYARLTLPRTAHCAVGCDPDAVSSSIALAEVKLIISPRAPSRAKPGRGVKFRGRLPPLVGISHLVR
jgi:hypothetical protein